MQFFLAIQANYLISNGEIEKSTQSHFFAGLPAPARHHSSQP